MSEDLTPKTELPIDFVITVSQFRSGAPWPVATLNVRSDGHVTVVSSVKGIAGLIFSPLLACAKRISADLMRISLRDELIRAHLMKGQEPLITDGAQPVPTSGMPALLSNTDGQQPVPTNILTDD